MHKYTLVPMALVSLAFAADPAAQSAVPDTNPTIGPAKPDLFKRIIANQKKGEAALDLYERIERVETRKNPNDPTPSAVKTSRVIPSGTGMVRIARPRRKDRKSTRLNSSHLVISYAVFCLKKKKNK